MMTTLHCNALRSSVIFWTDGPHFVQRGGLTGGFYCDEVHEYPFWHPMVNISSQCKETPLIKRICFMHLAHKAHFCWILRLLVAFL